MASNARQTDHYRATERDVDIARVICTTALAFGAFNAEQVQQRADPARNECTRIVAFHTVPGGRKRRNEEFHSPNAGNYAAVMASLNKVPSSTEPLQEVPPSKRVALDALYGFVSSSCLGCPRGPARSLMDATSSSTTTSASMRW